MVALVPDFTAMSRPLFRRSQGLIGLDLGTRFVKAAQVRPGMGGMKLVAIHSVPIAGANPLSRSTISHGAIRNTVTGMRLRSCGFAGHRAVVGLANSLAEPRILELPVSDEADLAVMVEQELQSEGLVQSDFWLADPADTSDGEMLRVSAVAVAQETINRCSEDLARAGIECAVIDALPFALSRAVKFVDRTVDSGRPVAALDWGAGHPSFVILNDNGPVFTRSLRNCGLAAALNDVQEQLGIDELECAQLLTTVGIRRSGRIMARIADRVGRSFADCLAALLDQLERTLAFVRQRGMTPERIWMFGCGGTIAGMGEALTEQLRLDVRPWNPAADQLSRPVRNSGSLAAYGAAAGFSLLNITK